MKFFLNILLVLFWGGFGWCIGWFISQILKDALAGTGGMLMAKGLLEIAIFPYICAIIGLFFSYQLLFQKK